MYYIIIMIFYNNYNVILIDFSEKQRERDERRGEKVVEPDVSTGCNPPTLRHTLNHKYTLRDKLIDTSRPGYNLENLYLFFI